MEEDRDILGKADALLRRHAPSRSGAPDGGDVPTLTELITPGGAAAPAPAAPASPREGALSSRDAFTRDLVAEVVNTVQARIAQLSHLVSQYNDVASSPADEKSVGFGSIVVVLELNAKAPSLDKMFSYVEKQKGVKKASLQ